MLLHVMTDHQRRLWKSMIDEIQHYLLIGPLEWTI